jgi:DNA-binding CsgD family transcriptional regulator
MYWNTVLNEVLNKRNKSYSFQFTTVGEVLTERAKQTKLSNQGAKKPKPDPIPLGEKYPDVYFSAREVQCALLFMQGKTILQTGKLLNLSPRTIEFYLNHMKRKLNCRLKSELIGKIMQSDLRKRL